MACLSRRLLLLVAGTTITILALLLSVLPTSHARACPPCGSTPVPYPLSTASGCGDPAYKVRCAANTTNSSSTLFFDALNGTSYPITSISPTTQRLVVSLAPFESSPPSACVTRAARGVQLDPSLPFNVSSSNTIMLLNCTAALLQSPLDCSATRTPTPRRPRARGCRCAARSWREGRPRRTASGCRRGSAARTGASWGWTRQGRRRRGGHGSGSSCSGPRPGSRYAARRQTARTETTPTAPMIRLPPAHPAPGDASACPGSPGAHSPARASRVLLRFFFFFFFLSQSVAVCWSGRLTYSEESRIKLKRLFYFDADPSDCQRTGDCGGSNHAPLVAGLVCGPGGALLVAAAALFAYRRQRRIRLARERLAKEREEILNANNSSGRTAKNFSGRELKRATGNFSRDNLLGSGGFGEVYKGVLGDGTVVAVKCAKLGNTKSTEQVLNEVRLLSQVNHRSLVRLLGCCVDLEQPLMVYEFIPNGTLADHLYGGGSTSTTSRPPPLPWRRRLAVALHTAEGVAYLHFSAAPPIYHRDIKSSNILLDDRLHAKVSDFGLSRLAEPGISHVSTCAQGTLGYLDPEYYRNYQLTDKSDVYSFGVVLLELLTSKRAIDFARGADDVNLAVHVQRAADQERLMDVVDPAIKDGATQLELDTMKALGFLALGCLEERRQNRPSMKEVAEEIEYIINIEAGGNAIDTH